MSRFLAGALAGLIGFGAIGCASSHRTDPASRTEGVRLSMLVQKEINQASFYQVETDGTLGFGGGFAARNEKTTWTGPLTDTEVARFLDILRTDGWFDEVPTGAGVPEFRFYRGELRWPEGRQRFRIDGACPSAELLVDLLDNAALRRLERELDKQPQARDSA